MSRDRLIAFDNVSKFYGEVLGVNQVTLTIEPGITSMVGPNGAGKTTLMNLMTGLLRPTKGSIEVFGVSSEDVEHLHRAIGYCPQFDTFPKGLTGLRLIASLLAVHGIEAARAEAMAWKAIRIVGIADAAERRVAGYSKGMRQKIKLALAIAHEPRALVLDEPLNGLDPMARAEIIELFRGFAESGMHVVVSSHIMQEVDMVADRIVMMSGGYVVADGAIHTVRSEMDEHPLQILIRCDNPALVASRAFEARAVVEVRIHGDGLGLLVSTRDADRFYDVLGRVVLDGGLQVESVAPADDNIHSVYQYLIGSNGGGGS